MNRAWHEQHPMPHNATVEQRIVWHRAHHEQCNCRPIPPSLVDRVVATKPSRRNTRAKPQGRA